MAKTRGTGLLMVWSDVDPEYEAEYHRWYDEEHIARLLAVPGFLSAGRYVALKGGPKNLALYELETAEVLRTAAFLDEVRFRPSAKRVAASGGTIGRNYIINGYRQFFPSRTHPIEMTQGPAPFLQMGRIDIPSVVEDEFNDWYNTAYIPPYLQVPGCLGARRYMAIELAAEIPDALRIREPDRLGERTLGKGARRQPMEQPHPPLYAARYRLARRLSPGLSQVTGVC